jgi:hypothetical protein
MRLQELRGELSPALNRALALNPLRNLNPHLTLSLMPEPLVRQGQMDHLNELRLFTAGPVGDTIGE